MPPDAWILMLWAWGACALLLALLWIDQFRRKDATLVDVGWTLGLGASGVWFAAASTEGSPINRWIAAGVATLWTLRLGSHLLFDRVLRHRGEDSRYAYLRTYWGHRANAWFFGFYQLQALAAAGLSLPYLVLARHAADHLAPVQWLGLAVIATSIAMESVADRQLAAWRADPAHRGKTCRHGLWALSRHPNYFFEWLVWVGLALVATPAPWGSLAWISPVVMLWLVTKVSGIPWAEDQALRSRGDDYRRYQADVSAFFPWFPRRATHTPESTR